MYEIIVSQILDLIRDGKLNPGDKLPSERKMAESLGCSRSSLREAFRVLESDGIIISKAGGGRYIQSIKKNLELEYDFDSINVLEKSAILYFIEAREVLEPKIVELAIQRATTEQIEKLGEVIKKMEESFKRPEEKINHDSVFHLGLAELTGNFVFVSMMETNLNMIKKIRRKVLMLPERYLASIDEHKQIYEAIKERDTNKAVKKMLYHLDNLRKNILKNV